MLTPFYRIGGCRKSSTDIQLTRVALFKAVRRCHTSSLIIWRRKTTLCGCLAGIARFGCLGFDDDGNIVADRPVAINRFRHSAEQIAPLSFSTAVAS